MLHLLLKRESGWIAGPLVIFSAWIAFILWAKVLKKLKSVLLEIILLVGISKVESIRDFPGGPVVKTLLFQCRGRGF